MRGMRRRRGNENLRSLRGSGKGSLCPFAGGPEPPESALVRLQVLLVLPLELLGEVVDHAVVEILASQMGVACETGETVLTKPDE